MVERPITEPIFFVGMPRSGTTVLFEVVAAHPNLGWFSQHLDRTPGIPGVTLASRLADLSFAARRSITRSDQARPWVEKFRVGPSEAYNVWDRCCGDKFRNDYLLGVEASETERRCLRETVAQVLRYHGKSRFAAKITGPGRIVFLKSAFPDARVVHIVRDGRAVVQSLMRVPFWRDTYRMYEPAWRNGLGEADLADWNACKRSPLALAAVQWRRVVRSIREEAQFAGNRYVELCYEHFVLEPHEVLDELQEELGLVPVPAVHEFLDRRFMLRNMNFQWGDRFAPEDVRMLDALLGPTLEELGYGVDPPSPPSASVRIRRPLCTGP